ncbi:uncharacterized protein SPPG_05890 [Spizellomyces punctatus DAOM BR117]|uniref:Uncharacterized protein n=1 Tax=Spizellomyces punctatus (strain DAOM BR117) TaxID=645134 RepID=A0A0L0HCM1_SPIPD|nr:uncharacterized protein SPPG_05890 [Spizellomyces punctatus DAOM BR117]KNC98927.1 hypothetical protein SPPG_05890 [Spizellomyces punctatus DAOM BR117]|eukprot:XP_016606967.1 hypothetical protein SPPG_05890 [Spizellomyces punctatus DAOM BR117]
MPPPKPAFLKSLTLPVICAPMFLVSGTRLVINACKQGIVGTFPALNTRNDEILDDWLTEIRESLRQAKEERAQARNLPPPAPYGVNLIVHKTNKRLSQNLDRIVKHQVPLVITSLGAARDVVDAVHSYGGAVFHDVTNVRHAQKAAEAGVDGLIAVCAGAGGHAGVASPFALIPKLREFFPGVICLAGAISDGASIRAAQTLGADVAYIGTRFIATQESMAPDAYKQMLLTSNEGPSPSFLPTVYTDKISGVNANFLRSSLERAGLDPENPAHPSLGTEDFSKLDPSAKESKAWRDIWSAGHSVINIHDIPTVETLVARWKDEYAAAIRRVKDL